MFTKIKSSIFVLLWCLWTFLFSSVVLAGNEEYRQCPNNETCEVGEFLFDDEYAPVTTATCTLTSKNPDGTTYLNAVAMTSETDGWYYYDVTTTSKPLGLYRSQVCCTYGTEYLCIDKSFDIVEPSSLTSSGISDAVWDTTTSGHNISGTFGENLQTASTLSADDIWSAPTRSLTSFGTLTADIWAYSSRTVSNLSSIVGSIWSGSNRTLTSTALNDGELATRNQVETGLGDQLDSLSAEVKANRYFLEQLVNAPIIETFIEEEENAKPNLQVKIQETKKIARLLSKDASELKKQILALNNSWDSTSYQIALNKMTTASRILGTNTQDSSGPESISARISWLGQKWNSPIISNLSTQATSALANIGSISREIKSYGKTFISKQYLGIADDHIGKLAKAIGEEGDSTSSETLFGYIANLENTSDILIKLSLELDALLKDWHEYTNGEKDRKLTRIKAELLPVNQIAEAEMLLKAKKNDSKHRENLALALQGVVDSNLILLAQNSNSVLKNIWLEHGSVIFRSLVSNPSNTISQDVEIKYYLPQEIGLEHIVEIENGLEAIFDTEKNTLYVIGKTSLDPGETKTFIVKTIDVWVIPEEEIASISKQAETLFNSLKNTSYFAQGSTIKADIEVNLDKISLLQKKDQTPELKIKSHREAMLELNSAQSKLESLKSIVSSAGSVGTLFGFVGGVQAIAVWGLIIILIAGFVFLSIYLKKISDSSPVKKEGEATDDNNDEKKEKNKKQLEQNKAIKKTLAKNKNTSTLSLLKEIIIIKLNLNKKLSDKKQISRLVKLVLVLIAFLFIILLLLLGKNNDTSTSLISPMPEYTAQMESRSGSPRVADKVPGEEDQEQKVAAKIDQDNEESISGLILGARTGEPIKTSTKKELVMAKIPTGYSGINVRAQPTSDGAIVSRLWVDQKVFILDRKDGRVLINTKEIDETKVIRGWIVEEFTSEIQ